jgi:hypothetical protein
MVDDHRRCDLHVKAVAELPQLLRCSRVLEEHTIDLEGIQFTGTVAIDSLPDSSNKRSQLRGVIVRNHRTRSLPLRLAGHGNEATHDRPKRVAFPEAHSLEIASFDLTHFAGCGSTGSALSQACLPLGGGAAPHRCVQESTAR